MEEKNNLKFPKKLWTLINNPSEIIKWGPNGTSILFDLNSMEDYLKSSESIFKLKRISSFINQLEVHEFRNISSIDLIQEYRNEFFFENCPELLPMIQRQKPTRLDLCQKYIPETSLIEKARLSLRNELVFKTIKNTLRENVAIVEVPEEYFDNPTEIIPNFSQHEGFLGFFGNHVSKEQLKAFFSEVKVEKDLIPESIQIDENLNDEMEVDSLGQSNEFLLPYESIKLDEIEQMEVSEVVDQNDNSNGDFNNLFSQIRESIDVLNE